MALKRVCAELILDVVLILRVASRLVVKIHSILGFRFLRALGTAEG